MDASRLNRMHSARLILDPPATGSWNMAADEALLRTAGDQQQLTLRVYRWNQPTLSLGYFQQYEQRHQHVASQHCQAVRRATGGGAIIHDQEVTYSLTAPVRDRVDPQILQWYDLVHTAWVTTLAQQGAHTRRCTESDAQRESPFLCFQRRTAGDLLLDGFKIGGSAQRRHRAAVLQHGSLLVQQSAAAPELPGIAQLAGLDLLATSWLRDWIEEIGRELGVTWETGDLDDQERELASELTGEQFESPKWTLRR